MIKIKEIQGYQLHYDDTRRLFVILNSAGEEEGVAKNQEEAEAKIKSLTKQEFKRIPIINLDKEILTGELTSLNKDEKTVWVSMQQGERRWSGGRQKVFLAYEHEYYEKTDANMQIAAEIQNQRKAITVIEAQIKELEKKLEKPINLAYFGL